MSKTASSTLRKKGGGVKGKRRDKRRSESITPAASLQVGDNKVKLIRGRGGSYKVRSLKLKSANMFDPSTKKSAKVEVIRVLENKANREYARRNIVTKGSIVETSAGKAVVVNRPGQSGQIALKKL